MGWYECYVWERNTTRRKGEEVSQQLLPHYKKGRSANPHQHTPNTGHQTPYREYNGFNATNHAASSCGIFFFVSDCVHKSRHQESRGSCATFWYPSVKFSLVFTRP